MFLGQLSEESKNLFLQLCIDAALANDVVEVEETQTIGEYCREMDIPKPTSYEAVPLDTLLAGTDKLPAVEKKIILTELLGLVKVDGVYDQSETVFIEKVTKAFGVSDSVLAELADLLDRYLALCTELSQVVLTE
jgi:hypothetical protein